VTGSASSRASRSLFKALFGRSLWPLIVLLGVGGGAIGLLAGLDYLLAPYWAKSHSGHPALVGYWRGEVAFAPGDNREVVLHLTRSTSRRHIRSNIAGGAKICGAKGEPHYSVGGRAANDRGTRFTLGFTAQSSGPGKYPGDATGAWDGKDQVELGIRLYTKTSDGQVVADSDGPRFRSRLRRSTKAAFETAC
jgi:hypothetical protein